MVGLKTYLRSNYKSDFHLHSSQNLNQVYNNFKKKVLLVVHCLEGIIGPFLVSTINYPLIINYVIYYKYMYVLLVPHSRTYKCNLIFLLVATYGEIIWLTRVPNEYSYENGTLSQLNRNHAKFVSLFQHTYVI